MNKIVLVVIGVSLFTTLLSGCSFDKSEEEARAIYARAENALNANQLSKARAGIDSINKLYPTVIEVRKEGIILKSKIALKESQDSLQLADSLLQAAKKNRASSEEVALRQKHFDMLCMKVRFYYKKIDKLNALKARMDANNE